MRKIFNYFKNLRKRSFEYIKSNDSKAWVLILTLIGSYFVCPGLKYWYVNYSLKIHDLKVIIVDNDSEDLSDEGINVIFSNYGNKIEFVSEVLLYILPLDPICYSGYFPKGSMHIFETGVDIPPSTGIWVKNGYRGRHFIYADGFDLSRIDVGEVKIFRIKTRSEKIKSIKSVYSEKQNFEFGIFVESVDLNGKVYEKWIKLGTTDLNELFQYYNRLPVCETLALKRFLAKGLDKTVSGKLTNVKERKHFDLGQDQVFFFNYSKSSK